MKKNLNVCLYRLALNLCGNLTRSFEPDTSLTNPKRLIHNKRPSVLDTLLIKIDLIEHLHREAKQK